MELKKWIYQTVHRSRFSVEELADAIGCSSSLLYRSANPNDPGARFPLERLLPLMNATRDFSILQHLASRAGFVLFRIPSRIRCQKTADLNKFQSIFAQTFQALVKFKDGEISRDECLEKVDRLLSRTLELRKSVESYPQLVIDFKEQENDRVSNVDD